MLYWAVQVLACSSAVLSAAQHKQTQSAVAVLTCSWANMCMASYASSASDL